MLTRRSLLIAMASAAISGCAREVRPTITSPVVVVGVSSNDVVSSMSSMGAASPTTTYDFSATKVWLAPVLAAFNASHNGLRAQYVPPAVDQPTGLVRTSPNASALLGAGGGIDLAPQLQAANVASSVLLPGVLQAAAGIAGGQRGIPIDLSVCMVGYAPSAKSLTLLGIDVPQTGWSTDQFTAFCTSVADKGGGFLAGLGHTALGSLGLEWLGYLEGYGGHFVGADGTLRLTAKSALPGLNAFADLLQVTWERPVVPGSLPPAEAYFIMYNGTSPGRPLAKNLIRFPRAPNRIVPAQVVPASVPVSAPQPGAGATFVVWLISRGGQRALTGIGYPSMRTDVEAPESWLSKGPAAVNPGDLRFPPQQLLQLGQLNFGRRLYGILLSPPTARPGALQKLEAVANSVIAGTLNVFAAGAQLNRDGILAV